MTGELKWSGKVHPVAALFPMMTDEELNDLGADIKANGLLHAIVLDDSGDLIDGRNRMEGCRRAKVPPRFAPLPDGADPREFIFSSSDCKRRNTTQGQRAMVAVMAYWAFDALEGCYKLEHSTRQVAAKAGVPVSRIGEACIIMAYGEEDLAPAVRDGFMTQSAASDEARTRKKEVEDRLDAALREQERFTLLQAKHPDLAAMVQEERLTMGEALAAVEARKAEERLRAEKEREYTELKTKLLDQALRNLDYGLMGPDELAKSWATLSPDVIGETADFSAGRARRCAETLIRYAELKENQDNG